MNTSGIGRTLREERPNAVLAWALVGVAGTVALVNVRSDPVWAGFAATVAVLGAIPAVASRSLRSMLPWEVLALGALPLLARTVHTLTGITPPGTGRIATYLAVGAVALIVAVELHVFTPVEMNDTFAVLFVVVATMAAAGIWAVARYIVDTLLGTSFLLPPERTTAALEAVEQALMYEFVFSTLAGVLAGVLFAVYFRRYAQPVARAERGSEAR